MTTTEPEVQSAQRLLTLLDKTFRTARTHDSSNQLAQTFIRQLFDELTAHLAAYGALTLLVRRFEFQYRTHVVYQKLSDTENLAFKLYADGVRELAIDPGLSVDDLRAFLEALGAQSDLETAEDDFITRLWERNLTAVSVVTAEQIVRTASATQTLTPQTSGTLNSSLSSLKAINTAEMAQVDRRGRAGSDTARTPSPRSDSDSGALSIGSGPIPDGREGGSGKPMAASREAQRESPRSNGTTPPTTSPVQSPMHHDQALPPDAARADLPQFMLSSQASAHLAQLVQAESKRNATNYLLDLLQAVLDSERSPATLSDLLALFEAILQKMVQEGDWARVNKIVRTLRAAKVRFDLPEEAQHRLASLLKSLDEPGFISMVTASLNAHSNASRDEVMIFLLNLGLQGVPSLCLLLQALKFRSHRLMVCEALAELAKDQPDLITKGLTDSRWYYVRNLVYVIGKLGNADLATLVEPLAMHPDRRVRLEAIRTLGKLYTIKPGVRVGNGHAIVRVLADPDESLRLSALKLLESGSYRIPFSVWARVVTQPEFQERAFSEVRQVFHLLARITGDQAIPYLRQLVTARFWFQRKRSQGLAALAAEALGMLGTPPAVAALEAGRKRYNRVIRHACTTALTSLKSARPAAAEGPS